MEDALVDFLNNPWVIGIGGGVLSGFIVAFASRKILSRRDQREYAQKVLGANREVVYAIRPGISEGLVPSTEVIESLLDATSRKFGVDRKDLYQPFEIAQELMKEVMDSSFISAKTKEDYCGKLGPLSRPAEGRLSAAEPEEVEKAVRRPSGIEEYRSRMVTMMSMMMGLLTAAMTLFLALTKDGPFSSLASAPKDRITTLLLPAALSMAVAAIAMLMMSVLRDFQRRTRDRSRDNEGRKKFEEKERRDAT